MDSSDSMHYLIGRFLELPTAEIAFGHAHADCSDPKMLLSVYTLWTSLFPFLSEYSDYLEWLQRCATAFVRIPATGTAICIPGCADFADSLPGFEHLVVVDNGLYQASWIQWRSDPSRDRFNPSTVGFYLSDGTKHPLGVYSCAEQTLNTPTWHSRTFSDWLERAIQTEGELDP